MRVLGIDPGHDGAAALLDAAGGLSALWSWRRVQRNGLTAYTLVCVALVGGEWRTSTWTVPTLGRVGAKLGEWMPAEATVIAHELPYVGVSVSAALSVAFSSGEVIGPIRALASFREVEGVKPTEWRSALGVACGKRADAKAQAEVIAWTVTGLSDALAVLAQAGGYTADEPHAAEAAGVARWRWLWLGKERPRPKRTSKRSTTTGGVARRSRPSVGSPKSGRGISRGPSAPGDGSTSS
jgi:hypothetical protein